MKTTMKRLLLFILIVSSFYLKSANILYINSPHTKDNNIYEGLVDMESVYSSNTKDKLPVDAVVTNGPKTHKKIALTFDDGPDDQYTLQVLNVLRKYNVKATFFLLGVKTKEYPAIAQQIVSEGHEIGNHTYNHPNLSEENLNTFKEEIENTQQLISKTTGITPNLFRAPYGNIKKDQLRELKDMNLTAIGWSIDSEDWKSIPSKTIQTNVLPNISSGSIILMHCAGHHTQNLTGTANALDHLIPKLQSDGYEFVTIPELMDKKFVSK